MANLGENGKSRQNGQFKGLVKYKWDDKKGHLDKWQFYKHDKFGKNLSRMRKEACRWLWVLRKCIFCEFGKGFIEGLAKNLNETTKEA